MRHLVTWVVCLAMLVVGAAAQTTVDARLLTPVSSYHTRSGSEISALVTTPLCLPGGSRIQSEVTVRGEATHLHKVGLGLIHESAGMHLDFDDLHLGDGRDFPLEVRLADIENARERIDKKGAVHGIRATASLSNRFGERLVFAAFGHPVAIAPLFAVETAVLHFPEPEIDYGIGTEIELAIHFPETLGDVSACPVGEPLSAHDQAELGALVAKIPAWSYSSGEPQDPVTLIYVGSKDEVDRAFAAAGWTGSSGHSAATRFHVVRAIAEDHAYLDAPMRTLLLDGAEPDFSLQKALDTFEKRDHLRIWGRPGDKLQDREVWASAATRDVATSFSMRPFGFAHRIQSDVDQERDKVVHDLSFTGCVDSVQYVERPPADGSPHEARKGIETDGRVAVVVLNSCREPRLEITERRSGPQPPLVVRCVRRVTLTARNHFLRDNMIWRSADAARIGVGIMRSWAAERKVAAAMAARQSTQAASRAPLQ